MGVKLKDVKIRRQDETGTTVFLEWHVKGSGVKKTDVYSTETKKKTKTYSALRMVSSFTIRAEYMVDGKWFVGTVETYSKKNKVSYDSKSKTYLYRYVYSAPSNAEKVRMLVGASPSTYGKAVYTKKVKGVKHYKKVTTKLCSSITASAWHVINFSKLTPDPPTAPTVDSVENSKVKLKTTTTDNRASHVQFKIYVGQNKLVNQSEWIKVNRPTGESAPAEIPYTYILPAGTGEYYSIARSTNVSSDSASNDTKNSMASDWSGRSETFTNTPPAPENIMTEPLDDGTVNVSWDRVVSADSYEIEWAINSRYFDSSTDVQSGTSTTTHFITSIESGHEWYFRVRAVNSAGNSPWSSIVSQIIAEPPGAPTTWSISSSFKVREDVVAYFTHNAKDGSKMTSYNISYKIGDGEWLDIYDVPPSITDENPIYSHTLPLDECSDGDVVYWKVRTKGVHSEYGDFSIERQLKAFSEPSLEVSAESTLTEYPYNIEIVTGPPTQTLLSLSISVRNVEGYDTTDYLGNDIYIPADTTIYTKILIPESNSFVYSFTPSEINLINGQSYTVELISSMSSGISKTLEFDFDVDLDMTSIFVDADIETESMYYTASIYPYCNEGAGTYSATIESNIDSSMYSFDASVFEAAMPYYGIYMFYYDGTNWIYNEEVVDIADYGITYEYQPEYDDEFDVTYDEEMKLAENVLLSVYRIEYDGKFTPIVENIPNDNSTTVIDVHPSLNIARYRIVAIKTTNGSIAYEDVEQPINESSIVLQWDESYNNIRTTTDIDDDEVEPIWSGTVVRLPYNISVSNNTDKDAELTEYIGREQPVSYYGTQIRTTGTWSSAIDKKDTETLKLLNELNRYMGNVYAREPKGSGYLAHVSVNMTESYDSLIIPVNISLVRVEDEEA